MRVKHKIVIAVLAALAGFLTPAPVLAQHALVLSSREETLTNRFSESVLKEAYGRIGMEVSFAQFPGARSVLEADQGRADGEVARLESIVDHYPNLKIVSVPIFYTELSVFIHKDFSKPIAGWDSFKDCRTTTILGFKYVQDKLADSTLDVVDTSRDAIQRVRDKKVDVAVLNSLLGNLAIRDMEATDVRELKPPLERKPVFHLLHKKHQALIPKLEAVLKKMEGTGELKAQWETFTQRELK